MHIYPAAKIIYFLKKQIGSSLKVSSFGIRTKIGKHDAIDPQTFLRWNEVSDREKIKQKTGKGWKSQKSAKNETSMILLW